MLLLEQGISKHYGKLLPGVGLLLELNFIMLFLGLWNLTGLQEKGGRVWFHSEISELK